MRATLFLVCWVGLYSVTAYAGNTVVAPPEEVSAAVIVPVQKIQSTSSSMEASQSSYSSFKSQGAPLLEPFHVSFVPHFYAGASLAETDYSGSTLFNGTWIEPGQGWGGKYLFNKLFFGYRFIPNLALEFAEVDLAKSANVRGLGGSVNALGILPVGNAFDVFGKIGFADMGALGAGQSSGDQPGLNYGIGTDYHLDASLSARAEMEHFGKVGSDLKANLFSFGLQYGF